MIKFNFLFGIMICMFILSCKSPLGKEGLLPVLDLSKEYPVKVLDAEDFADVEYIPLETNEHSIYSAGVTCCISDNYIITKSVSGGDFLFFNRQGKFLWRFNHEGPGPEEYGFIFCWAVDFTAKELFLSERADGYLQLKAYSFEGEYKRTLLIPDNNNNKNIYFQELYDYDKDYLIGYSSSSYYMSQLEYNRKNFSLVNKQTGDQKLINFPGGKFMNVWLFEGGGGPMKGGVLTDSYSAGLNRLIRNGNDFLLAESTSDTLYNFKNGILTPIAVQTPSVYSNPDVPLVISPTLYTDNYLLFNIIPMSYAAKPWETDQIDYLWDRRTGEIVKGFLRYPGFPTRARVLPTNYNEHFIDKNYAVSWSSAERLLELYQAGKLSGSIKEIASTLKEDDNGVLIIFKLK